MAMNAAADADANTITYWHYGLFYPWNIYQ